jgi:hypothetical protein
MNREIYSPEFIVNNPLKVAHARSKQYIQKDKASPYSKI